MLTIRDLADGGWGTGGSGAGAGSRGRCHWGRSGSAAVRSADSVRSLGARRRNADGLELGALGLDDGSSGRAAHAEGVVERGANSRGISSRGPEGSGSITDLLDEVGDLALAEVHVLVNGVLAGGTGVAWESRGSVLGAAQEGTEVAPQVSDEEVLSRALLAGRGWVSKDGGSPTAVEEVELDGPAALVDGGTVDIGHGSVKVRDERSICVKLETRLEPTA